MRGKIFDSMGALVFFICSILSWIFFWNYSQMPIFSFMAALLAAAMAWITYLFIKLLIVTFKR